MRFLHDNKVKGMTLTPSSENANYPASNLKDPRLSRHLRFTGDEDESLLVDSGGLLKDIFRATVNLLTDPESLWNWPTTNSTVIASGLYYDGKQFAKITLDAINGGVNQTKTVTGTGAKAYQGILKKGTDNIDYINVYLNADPWTMYGSIQITWATKTVVATSGILHHCEWLDNETVWVAGITTSIADGASIGTKVYGTTNGTYFYATATQIEDLSYNTPYVDGSRAAVSPNHAFEMPGMFIFKIKVRPWFVYDTSEYHTFYVWYIDGTHRAWLVYNYDWDQIMFYSQDGGNIRSLESELFDDGTSYDDINSNLIIFGAIRLDQQTGQRFFVIVDGSKQTEATSFSGTPDQKTSTFPTLSMGHLNSSLHADSQFESVQFWAWDGSALGAFDSEADIDTAMAGKPPIFEQVYQPKIKASYAALAGHNLSADALIYLQGNDWNSWNGPPFEQALAWDADIILKNFTEKEYAFWRFRIKNPSNVDGYIKLGLAYLGPYYEVEEFPDSDLLHKAIDTTKTSFSDGGQAYSRVGIQLKTYQISMGVLQEATRQSLLEMYAAIGLHKSFFLLLDENNQDKLPVLYCKLERGLTYRHAGGYLWRDEAMQFREVF